MMSVTHATSEDEQVASDAFQQLATATDEFEQ